MNGPKLGMYFLSRPWNESKSVSGRPQLIDWESDDDDLYLRMYSTLSDDKQKALHRSTHMDAHSTHQSKGPA